MTSFDSVTIANDIFMTGPNRTTVVEVKDNIHNIIMTSFDSVIIASDIFMTCQDCTTVDLPFTLR